MATFKVTLADNGYMVRNDEFLTVHEDNLKCHNLPTSLKDELLSELIDCVNNSGATVFEVSINVNTLEDEKR